jgi:hypothetical protein
MSPQQAGVKEPRFTYANRAGLELFEAKWEELIGLPSSRSAADISDVQQVRLDGARTQTPLGCVYHCVPEIKAAA